MSQAKSLSGEQFESEVQGAATPVLVDFYAPWCGPCQALSPILDAFADEFEGRIRFFKVNVEEEYALARKFDIQGVPTLVLFKDGREADSIVGLTSPQALRAKLERLAAVPVPAGGERQESVLEQ